MSSANRPLGVLVGVLALALLVALPSVAAAQPASLAGGSSGSSGKGTVLGHSYGGASNRMSAIYLGTTTLRSAGITAPTTGAGYSPFTGRDFARPTPGSPSPSNVPSAPSANVGGSGGAQSVPGLNAFDSGQSNLIAANAPLDIEPPDQGLCVGNGYALEAVNLVVQVYTTPSLTPVAGTMEPLAGLVGFPIGQQFNASGAGGGYILSDPRCLYDTGTGHWFLSFLYFGGAGVFSNSGNFPLGASVYGAEFVLVSTDSTPFAFDIYYIDVSSDSLTTNCPCFGDQPLIGADANTLVISTNEYPVFQNGFNGAQVYLFDKAALAKGSSKVNVVHFNIGQSVNPPDGACGSSGGLYCFYSVDPTGAPTNGSYDTSAGGTAWAVSSLDFFGSGDNRLAIWAFTNTGSITAKTPSIGLTMTLLGNLERYASVGQLVGQKPGPIPLGTNSVFGYANTGRGGFGCVGTCPEGDLASNGDGTQGAAAYAQGAIWTAVSTVVNVGGSASSQHMGVAFFVVNAQGTSVSVATQGYLALSGAQLIFPSVAAGPSGNGLVTFTLTGSNNYPSSAYAWVSSSSSGAVDGTVHVSAAGQSPQDGFSEYQLLQYSGFYRPRWGDYTWAVWSGGTVYFSTEYIQAPNCGPAAFQADPTCGGTRDPFANWGTSINAVAV